MRGIRCTGVMSSSASVCREHSGLHSLDCVKISMCYTTMYMYRHVYTTVYIHLLCTKQAGTKHQGSYVSGDRASCLTLRNAWNRGCALSHLCSASLLMSKKLTNGG